MKKTRTMRRTRRAAAALSTALAFSAPSLAAAQTAAATAPRTVAILIMGIGSSLPSSTPFNPLTQSYAGLSNSSNPALAALGRYFDTPFNAGSPGRDLTGTLAGAGAVILPYSYHGATLSMANGNPSMQINAYPNTAPGDVLPTDAATILSQEIQSVESAWPSAHIVIVGHSEGGLVAATYFRKDYSPQTAPSVTSIFSLDAPLNGVSDPLVISANNTLQIMPISPALGTYYTHLWQSYTQGSLDPALIQQDGQGVFAPVGTQGDLLYRLTNTPIPGTFSQMLFNSSPQWSWFGYQRGAPVWPDLPTPEPPNPPSLGWPWDWVANVDASHVFVLGDPAVIAAIGQAAMAGTPAAPRSTAAAFALSPQTATAQSGVAASSNAGGQAVLSASDPTPVAFTKSVAKAGETLTIRGLNLGSTGQVAFTPANGQPTFAQIVRWTPTEVAVTVPANAATGPVMLAPAGQNPILVRELTVLGAFDGVKKLLVAMPPSMTEATPETLTVTALGKDGRPVPGAPVYLSVGLSAMAATANAYGTASFTLVGFGKQSFVVYSGTAYKRLRVDFLNPPAMTLTMTSSAAQVPAGTTVTIAVHLTDAAGEPVADRLVHFQVDGPDSALISSPEAWTNASGVATVTLSNSGRGRALVAAFANHYSAHQSVSIHWTH